MLPPDQLISLLKFEGLMEELERKTDFKVRVQMTLKAIEDALPLDINCENKDSQESLSLKTQADKLVLKNKVRVSYLLQALKLYNKSIAKAEKSSIALAQAYANRSSVLFNLAKFEECINDIDRALELEYPDNSRPNLLRRKAKCLKILGKLEAEKVCEEARLWLEKVTLSDDTKEKINARINIVSKEREYAKPESIKPETLPEFPPHEKIPSASDAIDIKYSKDLGRHLIARRNIDAGEVLIVEKPYAAYLDPKNIYSHCSHCFLRVWDSIPCEYCTHAMYCSEKCRSEAWEQYHDIECPIKVYFIGMHMNDLAPFSLRITLMAVRESGSIKKLRKELTKIDNCKGNNYKL